MNGSIRTDCRLCVVAVTAVLALSLGACSSSKAGKDLVPEADSNVEAGGPEAVVFPDSRVNDLQDLDGTDVPVPDIQGEVPGPACAPGEGCFLDKCTGNAQCQSGWCVEHLGEGVCSQVCQDECPAGWSCKQVAGTDPDVVFICVSKFANLCRPCSTGADCKSIGGVDDVCVDYGPDGDFCGGACQDDDDCPWGFSCKEGKTVDGADVKQCVADTGTCPCTAKSVALAATTTCKVVNAFGECVGTRICTAEGLTACNAVEPAQESCNGIDDDCDGDVDEPALAEGKLLELCDDGNDCTEDSCTGDEGCKNTTLDSGSCDDANSCTVADHCVEGTCTGTPVECDDQNPCTDNVCTETGGCEFPVNAVPCDDGNPCTLVDQCVEGVCKGTEMPCDCQVDADCTVLEDGDQCNGSLACDTGSLPYKCVVDPATIVVCPEPEGENAFCLQGTCDAGTGLCSFIPNHEGFLCDNGDACTVNDKCQQGICTGGSVVNCNDGNPCTDDTCNPDAGCMHKGNQAPCNDGDLCTTDGHCDNGACVGGPALACDDGNPCTEDSCVQGLGCVHTSLVNTPCDDGNACSVTDVCLDGACVSTSQLECVDNNPCTDNVCDPANGCVTILNKALCDDGDLCTTGDYCHLGKCIHSGQLACDDGNVCTDDHCDPEVGCKFTINQTECDVGDPCTLPSQCAGGWCVAGQALDCDDWNVCTDDSCEPDEGCINEKLEEGTPCSDENPQVVCIDGECVCQPDCEGKECGEDGCGWKCGTCSGGKVCQGDACICKPQDHHACSGGKLWWYDSCNVQGSEVDDCDDGNPCSTDGCWGSECTHSNVGNGTPCGNDMSCADGVCEVVCGDGLCAGGGGETSCTCPQDCGSCAGCCAAGVCKAGTANGECGKNGVACTTCSGAKTCQNQACVSTTPTWTDPDSGLEWQNPPYGGVKLWSDAKSYCANLDLDGGGWHLPTISALRTLIRGCPGTVTAGACGVTDACPDQTCQNSGCWSCAYNDGPADGCYWPDDIIGTCSWYWSSSPSPGAGLLVFLAWLVSFDSGNVYNATVYINGWSSENYRYVRCVR